VDDIGTPTNLVATSSAYSDGSDFGSGTHTRRFTFNASLTIASKYYIYLDRLTYGCLDSSGPYTAGELYDLDGDPTNESAQFLVGLTTTT
jgi:hypothetical protein